MRIKNEALARQLNHSRTPKSIYRFAETQVSDSPNTSIDRTELLVRPTSFNWALQRLLHGHHRKRTPCHDPFHTTTIATSSYPIPSSITQSIAQFHIRPNILHLSCPLVASSVAPGKVLRRAGAATHLQRIGNRMSYPLNLKRRYVRWARPRRGSL